MTRVCSHCKFLIGSQKSITLHQGTKLVNFYPIFDIYVVDTQRHAPTSRSTPSPTSKFSRVDVGDHELTPMEREQLLVLLEKYDSLFPVNEPLGRTSVIKHDIITKGPPIRQKIRRLPAATKPIVIKEVHNMLNSGIIRHSVITSGPNS